MADEICFDCGRKFAHVVWINIFFYIDGVEYRPFCVPCSDLFY